MTALPASNGTSRKSFAQVAAAANGPTTSKTKTANITNSHNIPTASPGVNNVNVGAPEATSSAVPMMKNGITNSGVTEHSQQKLNLSTLLLGEPEPDGSSVQSLTIERMAKKDSSDTKSVASRTTLALDEKDSIRPDDSASMHAAADQDILSPSSSIIAASRADSNPDIRAFHQQLKEIDHNVPAGLIAGSGPVATSGLGLDQSRADLVFSNSLPPTLDAIVPVHLDASRGPPVNWTNLPDEKLLEALESPKDRLFVLKIEQDIIDFVRDSKEEYLQLPQTNSFYRMLSHKLADYYLLGHLIDESMTSVRIYRTPYCRLPPPLIGSESSAVGATPPPIITARKIMRRGMRDSSGHTIGDGDFSSGTRSTSKATSESGHASGSDEPKDKAALTREERENRYKEARARIFKDFKEDAADNSDAAAAPATDKDPSRSSSASGAKKTTKKAKPRKDDGFEARSAYSQYGGQSFSSYPQPAHQDGAFYDSFSRMTLAEQYSGQFAAPSQYGSTQVTMGPYQDYSHNSSQMSWQTQPYPQGVNNNGYSPNAYARNGYSSMQDPSSFHSPNLAQQSTPKASHPTLAGFDPAQQNTMYWPPQQPSYQGVYPSQPYYYNDDSTPYQHNYNTPMQSYANPTGYLPTQYHPLQPPPNAFGNQQFNPRSQSFIPQDGSAPGFSPSSMRSPPAPQRGPSGTPHMPGYAMPLQQAQQQQQQQQQAHGQSSIFKWGKPATLPAKPPPPASALNFQVPRNSDSSQPLPPNPLTGQRSS